MSSSDVENLRLDFPMLKQEMHGKPLIYLDSAATSFKPQAVIAEIVKHYTEENATVHRAVYEYATIATEKYSDVRRSVQKFIGAPSEDEIVFTRGTTESLNLVALSYGRAFIKSGDEILITEMEHHANIVPWQLLCEEVGARLIVVPINELGELDMEEFKKKLTHRTRIVAVCHISNVFGTINPIKEITRLAHETDAIVVVDGAQSVARIEVDVKDLDVDFYAFSGHKMYGPTGIGVLYGKQKWLDAMPPCHGGGDMIKEVTFAKTIFQSPPLKFEAGTPMIAQVLGLGAALNYIQGIGLPRIGAIEDALLEKATSILSAKDNIRIIGQAKNKGAIISFQTEGVHPLDIGTMIAFKGIAIRTGTMCAQPALRHFGIQTLSRISFGLYNTPQEVDAFVQALDEVLTLLGKKG